MKYKFYTVALAITLSTSSLAAPVHAGVIERACNMSDRDAANRKICGCIQQVADLTLKNTDQRKAAKFFKDPDKAQETRQSDNLSNEAFWKRYKNFGATATEYCG